MLKRRAVIFSIILASPTWASIKTTSISGYTTPKRLSPSQDISTDPLMAPLACPSLTRLNLSKNRNELTLLSSLKEDGRNWQLKLKEGLKFWDGSSAGPKDLEFFLKENLKTLLDDWLFDSKTSFNIELGKDKTVLVEFSKAPNFGPYVLNRVPFYKKDRSKLGFSCVGQYRIEQDGSQLSLKSPEHIILLKSGDQPGDLNLKHAITETSTPWNRYSHKKLSCSHKVDLPYVTLINWNKDLKPTNNKEFRVALTTALPRGALVRTGAGYWGKLVSGPILRHHPGYNKGVLVRDFDMNQAIQKFEDLGFLGENSKKTQIIIQSNEKNSVATKVTKDVLKRIGFDVKLEPAQGSNFHGRVSTVKVPWPDHNFIQSFHSQSKFRSDLVQFSSTLDSALEKYNLSLTKERPNFSYLQNIHRELYNDEPYTLFMTHQYCLEGKKVSSRVSTLNPDWLKEEIERHKK